MSTPPDPTASLNPLDAVIAEYLEAAEAGSPPDRDALSARHPDLADGLRAFFADLDRIDRQAAPLRLAQDPDTTVASGPACPPVVRYFGDYELEEEIARGGMGVVFKARQVSLNRTVALKMILAGELAGPSDVARFRAEAEAAAGLDHPNIVPIYEVGEHDGRQYFSMKYVDGPSLSRHPRGTLREEAARLAAVARAVDHAHRRGVLHRDLKPSNVLVGPGDVPLVTDFGLAKRLAETDRSLTAPGQLVGTPRYMAPEQAAGARDLTLAADVWGLGAILYERLTGRPAFTGEGLAEVLRRVREEEPPRPSAVAPGLDRDLETVCLKCLDKDPARRYASAAELADDLDRWGRGEPVAARRVGPAGRLRRWVRRNPVVAGLLTAVALSLLAGTGAATYFALQQRDQARQTEKEKDEVVKQKRRVQEHLYAAQLGLVQQAWESGQYDWVRELLDSQHPDRTGGDDLRGFEWHYWDRRHRQLRPLDGPAGQTMHGAAFSPDGRFVAATALNGTVRLWDPAAGTVVRTIDCGPDLSWPVLAFAPDGRTLAVSGRRLRDGKDQVVIVRVFDPATGTELFALESPRVGLVESLAFNRDGTHLGFGGYYWGKEGKEGGFVEVWGVKDRTPVLSTPEAAPAFQTSVSDVAFAPDGKEIVAVADRVATWNLNTKTRDREYAGVFPFGFAPDGRAVVAHRKSDSSLVVRDFHHFGKGAIVVADGEALRGSARSCAFHPDARHVALAVGKTVIVWDLVSQTEVVSLPSPAGSTSGLSFGPDGRELAISGPRGVWLFDWADARAGEAVLTQEPYGSPVRSFAFTPDGKQIAVGTIPIRVWDLETKKVSRTIAGAKGEVAGLAVSSDGRRLAAAYLLDPTEKKPFQGGMFSLWDLQTGEPKANVWTRLHPFRNLAFSPDGRQLCSGEGAVIVQPERHLDGSLVVLDAATGRFEAALQPGGGRLGWDLWGVAYSPDGRHLAACLGGNGKENGVFVWDLSTQEVVLSRNTTAGTLAYSPDGTRLAFASATESAVRVWDAATGQEVQTLRGQLDGAEGLAYSPDGRRLAAVSRSGTVRVWDLATGQSVLTLKGRFGVAFSPDGWRLATGGSGGVRIWDVTAADGTPTR